MAFKENMLCGNLQLAVWRSAPSPSPSCLNPTNHGWSHRNDCASLIPAIVPIDTPPPSPPPGPERAAKDFQKQMKQQNFDCQK